METADKLYGITFNSDAKTIGTDAYPKKATCPTDLRHVTNLFKKIRFLYLLDLFLNPLQHLLIFDLLQIPRKALPERRPHTLPSKMSKTSSRLTNSVVFPS